MNKKHVLLVISIVLILLTAFIFLSKSQMFIPANTVPLSHKTLIIDAGHGTPDEGAVSSGGIYESEINLKIAKKLKKLLKKCNVNVIMTRNDGNSLSDSKTNNKREDLAHRVSIRDSSGADAFISIHLNHFSESKYSGAQVFYSSSNSENKVLAEALQNSLIEIADPENTRSAKNTSDIYILKNSKIPAVLVECGFLSNRREAELMNTEEYQQKLAFAIYAGISKYFEKVNNS